MAQPFTPKTRSKLSTTVSDSSDSETVVESICSSDDVLEPTTRKPPSKPSVSRLSFPFVKAAKKPPSQKPVTAPKATSDYPMGNPQASPLPATSPSKPGRIPNSNPGLSPESSLLFSYHPNCNPKRHNYCHRGYSRHGLAHTKWFWATREEEWEEKSVPVRKNKPKLDDLFLATALDDSPPTFRDLTSHKRKTPMHPAYQPQCELPPMTIHPRRGDLSALRDPCCTEIDRTFVDFPMWTIGKTLWMHDVHIASQYRLWNDFENQNLSDVYDETESEDDPLETPSSSSSVIFSDDSDSTLVDSESEAEMSPTVPTQVLRSEKNLIIDNDNNDDIRHNDHQFTSSNKLILYRPGWWQRAYSPPSTPSTSHSKKQAVGSWTMNCYRRWECMAKVPRCDSFVDLKASTSSI